MALSTWRRINKEREMRMKQRKRTRWLTLALSVAMLLSAASSTTAALDKIRLPTKAAAATDAVFNDINLFQYYYQPWDNYVYNDKYAFQWIFGFNKLYDDFAFVATCYVDTIRCTFRYEGRDWLIQFWKGSYAVCAAIGGEIGIYSKPWFQLPKHYYAAMRDDWITMEMTIYAGDQVLFSRPFDAYWWLSGFQAGYLPGFYAKPRACCAMTARLQLKDAQMAALLAESLKQKGFTSLKATPAVTQADGYSLQGNTVCIAWRNTTESSY
jgi:hypothetical protein